MAAFFKRIITFFMSITAFISGLFGRAKKPADPVSEPTTNVEPSADPEPLRLEAEVLSSARTILEAPGQVNNYFGWPSIARLPNRKLAVACSGFRRGHLCPFGKAVMMTSDDEGDTYTGAAAVIETPLDDRDAGVVPFGVNGVIVTSFNNTREAQRNWNPDNAEYLSYLETVTDAVEARYLGSTFRLSFDGGETFGDIFISPVTSPHGPTALRDGSLLWVGRTFAEDDFFTENNRIEAWRVHTDGTMEFVGAVPPVYRNGMLIDACEPSCIELPDGTLLCHFRAESGLFTVYQTRSVDGGLTWSAPTRLLADQGGAPPHLYLHSSGVLISAYGYRAGPTYGVRLMLSADMGETWKTDLILWDDGVSSDLGYPATVERTDGTLLTVFYAKDEESGPAVIKQIRWKLV
ncbi:MAG: exo-alpha-sialidase [Clostridia bacterium]|nr:exo-alpha-sialidase [Clostridia bacterium]